MSKVDLTPARVEHTLLGLVEYLRSRYRPSGLGEAVVPVGNLIGLTSDNMTQAATKMSMCLMSLMTASDVGNWMEESSDSVFTKLREQEMIPSSATSILIPLDEVMVRMIAEMGNDKTKDAGWREASCGVVAMVDAKGEILKIRYFGRLPETEKQRLKSQLSAEVFH